VELGSRLLAGAVKGALFTASAPAPQRPPRRPRVAFLLTAANAVLCLGMGWWTWHVQREAVLVHQRWQEVQHLPVAAQAKPHRG
jgi:ferric-dicitrate binding protein FerR (iron transport regulator)